MPSVCKFTFDKGCETFFHGELIEGSIDLTTTKGKTIKGVYVFITGHRRFKWPDPQFTGDSTADQQRNYFWSYEKIVEECRKLRGSGVLPPTDHTYFFSFRPALEWPTSIEGTYGFIRYELSLVIERRYSHDNVFKKPITIIKPFDLNWNPNYREPAVSDVDIPTCCSPITRCKLSCTLQTNYSAYAPGQIVQYRVGVHNNTGKRIDGFDVKFLRRIKFVATRPSHSEQLMETELISRYIEIRPVMHYVLDDHFAIPATPPTSYTRNRIYVDYLLKVQAKLSCCFSTNLDAEVKVVIGTVPIKESLAPCQLEEHSDGREPDIKPPTYAMDVVCEKPFIDTDVDEMHRIVGYRPQYPVYRPPASSTTV